LSLTLGLGNTSATRKRVSVVVHDNDFSDFSDCSFWLEPNQSIKAHTVKLYTTKAWSNATVSLYAGSVDNAGWIRLDDVNLRATPGVTLVGTECIETASASGGPGTGPGPGQTLNGRQRTGASLGRAVPRPPASPRPSVALQPGWVIDGSDAGTTILAWPDPINLLDADAARLTLESKLSSRSSAASVEVSRDGRTWSALAAVPASDDWIAVTVDLSEYLGSVVYVRFVYETSAPAGASGQWWLRHITVEPRLPQTPQSRPRRLP
jgi:hypothetical protein